MAQGYPPPCSEFVPTESLRAHPSALPRPLLRSALPSSSRALADDRESGFLRKYSPGTPAPREKQPPINHQNACAELRRYFLATHESQQSKRPAGHPSPSSGENRRVQNRLLQQMLHGFRLQKMKHIFQRKAVLLAERNIQAVVNGSRLCNSKLNERQKRFLRARPQAFMIRPPNGA